MLRNQQLIALAALLALPAAGLAQTSTTQSFSAQARVHQIPITLTVNDNLELGEFAPWGVGGWIAIHPLGTPASSGDNVTISSQGSPGRFTVTGTPHLPFTIVLPPSDRSAFVSNTTGTPGSIMVIEYFFSSYDENGTSPILNASGAASFTLGAKLLVNPNQHPGVYTGSFPLTVAY